MSSPLHESSPVGETHPVEDPALTSARREAILVGIVCVCAMTYTITYCYLFGYARQIDDLKFVFGFPDWVFWGIVTPWALCVVFSWYFGAVFFRDAYLGDDLEGSEDEDFFVKEGEHAG